MPAAFTSPLLTSPMDSTDLSLPAPSLTCFYPSLQIQQAPPANPKPTPAQETGRLTVDFHFSFGSSHPNSPSLIPTLTSPPPMEHKLSFPSTFFPPTHPSITASNTIRHSLWTHHLSRTLIPSAITDFLGVTFLYPLP